MPTRPAAVAGTWYPGTAGALTQDVTATSRPRRLDRRMRSGGDCAACRADVLRARSAPTPTRRRRDRTRTTSPCWSGHRTTWRSTACRSIRRARSTRRSGRRRDRRASWRRALMASPADPARMPAAHRREHSLEMQLPFLRRLLPDVRIVPLLMGYQMRETITALAAALAAAFAGRRVLIVASTDLSHYFDAAHRSDARRRRPGRRSRRSIPTACSDASSSIQSTSAGATWRAAADRRLR